MPLLNYTTSVAAEKTVIEIQRILAKAGARRVMTEYGPKGSPVAVVFEFPTVYGPRNFALPANPEAVQKVMWGDGTPNRYQGIEQAERVAWRILKDWVESQLALVATEMVTFDQIMLPYMRGDNGQTVYEVYRDQQLALPNPSPI